MTHKSALFQSSIVVLCLNLFMTLAPVLVSSWNLNDQSKQHTNVYTAIPWDKCAPQRIDLINMASSFLCLSYALDWITRLIRFTTSDLL